ncbi:ACT domain-containing protein [Desulforhopalus sp. 52FAK]
MTGITDLEELLQSMSPKLSDNEYVFCTVRGKLVDYAHTNPLASFMEDEGLTLILAVEDAETEKLSYDTTFKHITLTVHSSLNAVGLTAAVANKLASHDISANVIAAYYHDHIFVQSEKAHAALCALREFE